MSELLTALGLMAGIVGTAVALVQLMHWSEVKRMEILQRHIIKAYNEGYQKGQNDAGA